MELSEGQGEEDTHRSWCTESLERMEGFGIPVLYPSPTTEESHKRIGREVGRVSENGRDRASAPQGNATGNEGRCNQRVAVCLIDEVINKTYYFGYHYVEEMDQKPCIMDRMRSAAMRGGLSLKEGDLIFRSEHKNVYYLLRDLFQ